MNVTRKTVASAAFQNEAQCAIHVELHYEDEELRDVVLLQAPAGKHQPTRVDAELFERIAEWVQKERKRTYKNGYDDRSVCVDHGYFVSTKESNWNCPACVEAKKNQ